MRKMLIAAALVSALVPGISPAADTETVTIVGSTAFQGAASYPQCANAQGHAPLSSPACQKTTVTRAARCLYLQDAAAAQSKTTKEGKLGFLFKIDPTKTNSYDSQAAVTAGTITEANNLKFSLTAVDFEGGAPIVPPAAVPPAQRPSVKVPDVDVVFYLQTLGSCEGAKPHTAVPGSAWTGVAPIQPDDSSPFFVQSSYMGFGDEVNKQFPSARYKDAKDDKFKTTTIMWAIVTVVGGPNTKVQFTCASCAAGAITML